jgi:hypothetical protein
LIEQPALVRLAHPMLRYAKTAWQGAVDGQSTTAQARAARTAPTSAGITFHDAGVDFLEAAERGSALDRYGRPFTDESLSELRWCLTGHADKRLGAMDLGEITRHDVEALLADLAAGGLSRRRQRAVAKSLRALYDHARERNLVSQNPAERVALPDEADAEQPSRDRPSAAGLQWLRLGGERATAGIDRAIALGLQAVTVCFVLLALVLIAESL